MHREDMDYGCSGCSHEAQWADGFGAAARRDDEVRLGEARGWEHHAFVARLIISKPDSDLQIATRNAFKLMITSSLAPKEHFWHTSCPKQQIPLDGRLRRNDIDPETIQTQTEPRTNRAFHISNRQHCHYCY